LLIKKKSVVEKKVDYIIFTIDKSSIETYTCETLSKLFQFSEFTKKSDTTIEPFRTQAA